ncbi:MAG: 3-hydroxyisobutyrate dehydrogenase [Acidibrevibacterium sp.]|uniref:3-hydroxyisobutyrate dehydrogenase n=1 Tax=Acidibrevibacterium sp. TaxID=2606776 RepID=UPI003D046091
MTDIAFIGLGNMGAPMAANLVRAGHRVRGFDLNPELVAAHQAAGGIAASSALAACEGAEIAISMLPAGAHVCALYLGDSGVIAALRGRDALLIDSSTIDVETARAVAEAAAAAGLAMLDAPVSGGVGGAQAGTLTFMVGGEAAAFARARPILAAMGKNIVHAGGPGAGQAAKICNNMILGVSMLAVCEAFVLADRLGLAREKLFEVSSTSSGQCWSLTSYCPVPGPVPTAPSNRDYAPGFAASLMLKDLKLAQQAAEASGAVTPLGASAASLYQRINDAGLAGKDFSAAFTWLAAQSREVAP